MSKKKLGTADPKVVSLRQRACLNSQPHRVSDPLFTQSDFFDARDVIQVKYEMLRRVRVNGDPVAESSRAFGFSRPSFYQAQGAFDAGGLPALLPKKPGPRSSHKLREEIVDWLARLQISEPGISSTELAERVEKHFSITAHPRSIERALSRRKKKHR